MIKQNLPPVLRDPFAGPGGTPDDIDVHLANIFDRQNRFSYVRNNPIDCGTANRREGHFDLDIVILYQNRVNHSQVNNAERVFRVRNLLQRFPDLLLTYQSRPPKMLSASPCTISA